MTAFRLTMRGRGSVMARIQGLAERAADASPAFEAVGSEWLAEFRDMFHSEGSSAGHPWEPLQVDYAVWKEEHFPGQTILRRTDRLYDSLTEPGGPDNIFEVGPNSVRVGTTVPYADYHHEGTPKMPQRSLAVGPEFRQIAAEMVASWLDGGQATTRGGIAPAGMAGGFGIVGDGLDMEL